MIILMTLDNCVCAAIVTVYVPHLRFANILFTHTQSTHTLDSSSEHQKSTATNKILYSGKLVKWNSSGINLWRSNPFNTIANVGQIELKAFIRDWIRFVKYFLLILPLFLHPLSNGNSIYWTISIVVDPINLMKLFHIQ